MNDHPPASPGVAVQVVLRSGILTLTVEQAEMDLGELCGYAWYALHASTSARGVTTHFSDDTVYAYKNLTLPEHRGLRIQRWIKSHCLSYYQDKGKRGIIVAIESQNFASRRSTVGSGGTLVGFWPFAMGDSWYWGVGSPGCKSVGYRLTDARDL